MTGFSSTDMQELKDIVRIGQVSKGKRRRNDRKGTDSGPGHSYRRFKDCKTTANRGM